MSTVPLSLSFTVSFIMHVIDSTIFWQYRETGAKIYLLIKYVYPLFEKGGFVSEKEEFTLSEKGVFTLSEKGGSLCLKREGSLC